MQRSRPRRRHQFLLIAATLVELKARRLLPEHGRHGPRRGVRPLGGARPAARPAARVQDVQGRRHGVRPARRRCRLQLPAPRRARRALRRRRCPTCSKARASPGCATRRSPRSRPARSRRSTCSTSTRSRPRSPTRSPSCSTSCHASGTISFRRLTADLVDRIEVIIRFLAVLELFKQGVVELDQPERFGDIEIEWCAGRRRRRRGDPRRRLRGLSDDRSAIRGRRHHRAGPRVQAGDRGDRARGPRPGRRPSCWPSCSSSRWRRSSAGATSCAAEYAAERRGFELARVAGGYRYQTASRPDPVRRALPAPRPAGTAVGRGARDAGDRRLQAADLAGPGRRRSAASTPTA